MCVRFTCDDMGDVVVSEAQKALQRQQLLPLLPAMVALALHRFWLFPALLSKC